ncbi:helix-hairpin-helix domain-containing protein [Simiduia sp. 21SJ11W-1]|uniref:ComEA family DNA-binding protein n=1 Tax=Simiduia sp. 21SJ11W-1 TaxID=2909669 RepID=UPI00209D04E3|nr:helix-hairpin-helix domain-containing protein [Simiduia sp. 21SJ11W-1]UTA47289.1 helix-hairpin-helix domain-containing protein [Simiduia sp. 21SJ11W-1]
MTFVLVLLTGAIAYLLTRVQFLLLAQRDDLADLHAQLGALRAALTRQAKGAAEAPPSDARTPTIVGAINSVSKNGLQKIPGVGAACAQRVIDARPFTSFDELGKLQGLSEKQKAALKLHLTLNE